MFRTSALFLIVALFGASLGSVKNWNGYGDTLNVHGFNGTETAYTDVVDYSDFEDIAVVVLGDDTSSVGFASDSLQARYGYQLGYPVYNSSGVRDTLWGTSVCLDTLDVTDSAGTASEGSVGADGTITSYLGDVDTTTVSGYAAQVSWFVPKWAPVLRFWVTGMSLNKATTPVVFRFAVLRRLYSEVH